MRSRTRRHASAGSRAPAAHAGQQGITYLGLLLAVALTSAVLAASTTVWSHHQRREREAQLLWAGDQYRRAIESYVNAAGVELLPGASRYPMKLEDLLDDHRTPVPRRHLRRLYDDPMSHGEPWGLMHDEKGGITGVYSEHDAKPIRTARFPKAYEHFAGAASYTAWRFAVVRSAAQAAAEAAQAARDAASAAAAAAAASAAAGGSRIPSFTPTPVAPAPLPPVAPQPIDPPQDVPPPEPDRPDDVPADEPPPNEPPPDNEPSPDIESPESPSQPDPPTPAESPKDEPASGSEASPPPPPPPPARSGF